MGVAGFRSHKLFSHDSCLFSLACLSSLRTATLGRHAKQVGAWTILKKASNERVGRIVREQNAAIQSGPQWAASADDTGLVESLAGG
jgi:hypothetical protein